MKEFVSVEFLVENGENSILREKLENIGDDFQLIKDDWEITGNFDTGMHFYKKISGKINSITAIIIKLQDPFLAEHMRISHIPEDLKNKYRT